VHFVGLFFVFIIENEQSKKQNGLLMFTPVSIIPPVLHIHLHLHIAVTRRKNGRSLGPF